MTKKTLKEYCIEFDSVLDKYSDFGACDSEPQFHFRNALYCKIFKETDKVPEDARSWELYSSRTGVGKASKEMTSKLNTLIKRIPKAPFSEVKEVLSWYGLEEN
jgi:hypothetical protein